MVVHTSELRLRALAAALGVAVRADWGNLPSHMSAYYRQHADGSAEIEYTNYPSQYGYPLERTLAHELAHHLGPSLRTYSHQRPEHEIYAQACAAYALGVTRMDEAYMDEWFENAAKWEYRLVNWDRVRAMVQIVGEHLRAAIECEEVTQC